MSRWFTAAVTMLAVLVIVGCGPEGEPTGTITGKVMSGDAMIGNCKIAISNVETRTTKAGMVDDEGNFKLEKIPFGEYKVCVYPKPTNTDEEIPDPRIPRKVRKFGTSGVSVSVLTADEVVLDIDVKK